MSDFSRLKRNLLHLGGLWPFMHMAGKAAGADGDRGVFRVAFGSCCHQDKPQPVWEAIVADRPDVFIFLGDNIYGDTDDPEVLKAEYAKLGAQTGYARLRDSAEICAIWDDHDFGRNDAGREYEMKEESRRIMLDFFNEPAGSERWDRPDGIYTSCFFGPAGRIVQVILPDLRWNRDPLLAVSREEYASREAAMMGPYIAHGDSRAELLGERQWQWLEEQFDQPADYRIIGSTIQLLPEFSGWETWANFPHERDRFIRLMQRHQQTPTLIISGDVHWCELSSLQVLSMDRPILELTSSGLTEIWEAISPNIHRVGKAIATENYGLITLDWNSGEARLQVKDKSGAPLIETSQSLTA